MAKTPTQQSEVIDFQTVQAQKLEEKRRKNERVLFKNMLGVYSISDDEKMKAIEILDVSDSGVSFRVPFNAEKPWPTDMSDLTIRLYFTQDTYIPVRLKVQNSKSMIEEGIRYVRYGCQVDSTTKSYETFKLFVQFMKAYATEAYQDQGSVQVFYI